jgi:hypothetical protein
VHGVGGLEAVVAANLEEGAVALDAKGRRQVEHERLLPLLGLAARAHAEGSVRGEAVGAGRHDGARRRKDEIRRRCCAARKGGGRSSGGVAAMLAPSPERGLELGLARRVAAALQGARRGGLAPRRRLDPRVGRAVDHRRIVVPALGLHPRLLDQLARRLTPRLAARREGHHHIYNVVELLLSTAGRRRERARPTEERRTRAAAAARMRVLYTNSKHNHPGITTKRSLALPTSTLVLQHLCSVQPCAARYYRARNSNYINSFHLVHAKPEKCVVARRVRPRPRTNHPTRRITTL